MSWHAKNLKISSHCFFGAAGGVSKGRYSSLNTNFKSEDLPENVTRNFEIIASCFNKKPADMCLIIQGVTDRAVYVDEPSKYKITADGMVTKKSGLLLGIKTADCAPVLFADYQNKVIGAAHAGWRGAYKGVIENTLRLMLENGAELKNICAAIGPCIQRQSFEVQSDMKDIFLQLSSQNGQYFTTGKDENHFYFDLSGYVCNKLHELGVENVENCGIDTYPEKNGYFSYRRDTHLNIMNSRFDYPTQYSFIMLEG